LKEKVGFDQEYLKNLNKSAYTSFTFSEHKNELIRIARGSKTK